MLIEAVEQDNPVGQLPLSGLAARRLTLALLQSQSCDTVDAIRPIEFVYDPALCLWCLTAQRAEQRTERADVTLRDLAKWWQRTDWNSLRWRIETGFGVPAAAAANRSRGHAESATPNWGSKLARTSARAAWSTCHTTQQLLDDPRVTRALLFNFREWLQTEQHSVDWESGLAAKLHALLRRKSGKKLRKRIRKTKLPGRMQKAIRRAWSSDDQEWKIALGLATAMAGTERVEFCQQALQREKLASLRELAYGASHEINNPLTNISLRAQNMLRGETDPKRRRDLKAINDQAFRAYEMIADLMLFAKPPTLDRQVVDPRRIIDTVIEQIRDQADEKSARIIRSMPKSLPNLFADPAQLQVALAAICKNALEAMDETGGRLRLRADSSTRGSERLVLISVEDDGPGIPESIRKHIFDPFFSGREAGRGLGFGLSKAWRIVTDHGGRLSIGAATENGDTRFLIELPTSDRTVLDRTET